MSEDNSLTRQHGDAASGEVVFKKYVAIDIALKHAVTTIIKNPDKFTPDQLDNAARIGANYGYDLQTMIKYFQARETGQQILISSYAKRASKSIGSFADNLNQLAAFVEGNWDSVVQALELRIRAPSECDRDERELRAFIGMGKEAVVKGFRDMSDDVDAAFDSIVEVMCIEGPEGKLLP